MPMYEYEVEVTEVKRFYVEAASETEAEYLAHCEAIHIEPDEINAVIIECTELEEE